MKYLVTIIGFIIGLVGISQDEGYPIQCNPSTGSFATKTTAIVIGVSQYENLRSSKQLHYAHEDALMMVDYLKSWENIEIHLFTNKNATNKDYLGQKIAKALNNSEKGDKVIIYFSGHGDVNMIDNDGYLLLNQVDNPTELEYTFSDALPIKPIKRRIQKAEEKGVSVYLIFDACKSGFAEKSVEVNNVMANTSSGVLMLSSKANQLSQESNNLEHGVFTYHLVHGLSGLADLDNNLIVEKNELEKYVYDNVKTATNGSQTPIIQAPSYDYVLARYKIEDKQKTELARSEKIDVLAEVEVYKGQEQYDHNSSSRCEALFELLKNQTREGVFFPDEVEPFNEPIQLGVKLKKEIEVPKKLKISNKGEFYGVLNENKLNVFKSSVFLNPIEIRTSNEIIDFVFSPDEKFIVTCDVENNIILWNPRTGDLIQELSQIDESISTVEFKESSSLLLGSESGKVYIFNLESSKVENKIRLGGNKIVQLMIHENQIFSLDNKGQLSHYDIVSQEIKGRLKENVIEFSLLPDKNKLITISTNHLKEWNLFNLKQTRQIEFKENLSALSLDDLERYCFIGNDGGLVHIIDLFNFSKVKSRIKSKSNVKNIGINAYDEKLIVVNQNEVIEYPFHINTNMAAFNIRQMLNDCSYYKERQDNLDGSIIVGLNNQITPIIRSLIKEEGQVSLEDLNRAQRYAKMAYSMRRNLVLDESKLEINMLLLNVYEILLLRQKDRYFEGIEITDRIIELDPNGSYAFNISGQLYQMLNDMLKAKECFEKAEEKAPNWISPKIQNGEIYLSEGNYKKAEAKFSRIIELDPGYSRAYRGLIEVYTKSEKNPREKLGKLKSKNAELIDSIFPHVNTLLDDSEGINEYWKQFDKYEPSKTSILFEMDCVGSDCFSCLYNMMDKRGVYKIEDKIHNNVIISFTKNNDSRCYEGKVEVLEGKIFKTYIKSNQGEFILFQDEFYDISNRKIEERPNIVNGISQSIYTKSGNEYSVIFTNKMIGGTAYKNGSKNRPTVSSGRGKSDTDGSLIEVAESIHIDEQRSDSDKLKIGDRYEKGIIFYIDPSGKHGLIMPDVQSFKYLNWQEAIDYCQAYEIDGNRGWKLASINELKKLSFSNLLDGVAVFWSMESNSQNPKEAYWYQNGGNLTDSTLKSNKRFVIPVKSF